VKRKKTILVIDDSSTTQMLLEWTLHQEGYIIQIAESVDIAREVIAKKKPDLILLDLSMPRVSGFDFLRMKPELDIMAIPILVVSAYDSSESVKLTKELGAAEFIAKPFNMAEMLKILKRYLK